VYLLETVEFVAGNKTRDDEIGLRPSKTKRVSDGFHACATMLNAAPTACPTVGHLRCFALTPPLP